MYKIPRILPAGDKAVVVEYGDEISEECNKRVLNLYSALKKLGDSGITSMIPTYRSLLIKYEPLKLAVDELTRLIAKCDETASADVFKPKVLEIPVAYGGDFGQDLDFVAEYHHMTPDEVINIHTSVVYRIYMLGFTMGFAYLGGMSEKIATPRLEKPRTEIPAGSVGIAASQTGIYPVASPGGWRLIGKTPVRLYDPLREKPILLEAGNYIKFVRVSLEEFYNIEERIKKNDYEVKTYDYQG